MWYYKIEELAPSEDYRTGYWTRFVLYLVINDKKLNESLWHKLITSSVLLKI